MTIPLPPNTATPSHVSTKPQCVKNKYQKIKMFHSMLKSHAPLNKKHSPNVGMISGCSFKKNEPSPMSMQMEWFSSIASRKMMAEITNPLQTPTTLKSPKIMAKSLGVPPQTLHSFHVHLCTTPHIVCQNPCDTAPPMLPHGDCTKLLSNHALYLPHCKTYMPHHWEASHAKPLKRFSALSHCSHFWS